MATGALPRKSSGQNRNADDLQSETGSVWDDVRTVLRPLASLKLTVTLFALAIFLIFAGTLAQTRHDIGWVLHNYFRTLLATIELNTFFPPAWFSEYPGLLNLPGSFPFPGGFTIGTLMAVNLLAAHGVRFKTQAKGTRLLSGLAAIAAGLAITWWVIVAGPDKFGSQSSAPSEWLTLWKVFLVGLSCVCVGIAGALFRLDSSRKLERAVLAGTGCALLALLAFLLFRVDAQGLNPSAMRILWQLLKAELAAGVLLVGCILVFRKRAGIVLLHAGIGLVLANELVVHFLHKEAQMTLSEGQTVNYASDIRTVELAVIDKESNPAKDLVVVVPEKILKDGLENNTLIISDKLPFDLRVVKYFANSELREIKPNDTPIADAGIGKIRIVEPLREITGADGERINIPSAYVSLFEKGSGKPLGTFLLSVGLRDQKVDDDGKNYEIGLRFQRNYKNYTMHLYEVRNDLYLGTKIPKNFSSDLQLVDPAQGTDRRVSVHMNEPFRYGGETFYQIGFDDGARDGTNKRSTTLQVASNFGWMIPYVACMIVATGLLANFGLTLARFLRRRQSSVQNPLPSGDGRVRVPNLPKAETIDGDFANDATSQLKSPFGIAFAIGVCAITVLTLGLTATTPKTNPEAMDLYAFGKLPALAGGRVQPIDTLARNTLRMLSGRETYLEASGITFKASDAKTTDEKNDAANAEAAKSAETKSDSHVSSLTVEDVTNGSPAQIAGIQVGDRITKLNGVAIDTLSAEQISELVEGADQHTVEYGIVTASQTPRTIKVVREYQPAVKWMLEVAARPDVAMQQRVLRIESLDVLAMFNLRHRSGYRYSAAELAPHAEDFRKAIEEIAKKPAAQLTTFDKKAKELDTRADDYQRLSDAFHVVPIMMGGLAEPLPDIFASLVKTKIGVDLPDFPSEDQMRADPQAAVPKISAWLQTANYYAGFLLAAQVPMTVPLADTVETRKEGVKQTENNWLPYSGAMLLGIRDVIEKNPPPPAIKAWRSILDAYTEQQPAEFNTAVADYADELAAKPPQQLAAANPTFEAWFNHWSPFFTCQWLYFTAFCFAAFALLGWSGPLNRTAFWMIFITFLAYTFALGARMYISGRPPVTNLYSSAIFIGWAAVLAGLVLESVYRLGFGNMLASIAGFATLLVADKLSLMLGETKGDTMAVMQAVLDTQFWLATHVTCEVLGYTATFVAGLLGIFYVVRGLFSKSLSAADGKDLIRMLYGTVCFGLFFSFVGTVLGGLWADDSWGRFWGWDPKENGALIIVLWNALVLHARWDGLVKDRGLAVLAIGGNIVTSWSYFGVNQLGVGLHSYGFTEGVLVALALFCLSQFALIACGLVPLRYWRSRRDAIAASTA